MMPSPLAIEKIRQKMVRHGHSLHGKISPTYRSWMSMRARCLNPNHQAWNLYGGRGIVICKRWDNFKNFLNDMGERPPGKTLDRKNPYKGYEPSNCRWATPLEQTLNQRPRGPSRRTHCFNGHDWIKKNIYVSPKGNRQCWVCMKVRERKYRLLAQFPKEEPHV